MDLGLIFVMLPILLFSVIVHECSHGLVALWNGDPTAKQAGRLTLNPIPHIDPFGSILLPGMLLLLGSRMLFAWAKPVPVNVYNLRNPANDSLKVAAAGPVSNLLLAFVFALVISISARVFEAPPRLIYVFCGYGILLNSLLAVFNLLPIPPLDGHWLLLRFLPPHMAEGFQRVGFMGIMIIFALFWIPGVRNILITTPVFFLFELISNVALVPASVQLDVLYSLSN